MQIRSATQHRHILELLRKRHAIRHKRVYQDRINNLYTLAYLSFKRFGSMYNDNTYNVKRSGQKHVYAVVRFVTKSRAAQLEFDLN